ncbi:two-component system sensor histidine kinase YesM [Paenibacillus sp. V4I9]|uniref:sensor histidine kinase n=1 Tax=Paenibacillus sp. V4I9 TaxID=3042308 RepID=UPI00278AC79E|nr:histidine kinase [Paenibacillus sp. V4I9]MDQ0886621.1 two-component system sensor histidine kinase YesM [Paenibacillus sp. V4I9]
MANPYFNKLSPTRRRIIIVSVLLTVLAQIVLLTIGLSYVNNINHSVQDKRETNVSNQFYKNTLTQLGELSNLMQLLQSPDFSDFFKSSMNVRDVLTVTQQKNDLLSKLNDLHLSTKMVQRIYFIGSDMNQLSFRKDTDLATLTKLPNLRMDMFQENNMDQVFLKDNNRLTRYSQKDFDYLKMSNQLNINVESKAELYSFINDLTNKLVISNGNVNGVLVIMELNKDLFRSGLPDVYSDVYQFSILNHKDELVWSSADQQELVDNNTQTNCQKCVKLEKELNPYPYRVIFKQTSDFVLFSKKSIFSAFIALSCLTALVTFLISYFYTKKIFYPYLVLTKKMQDQARSDELILKYISDEWIKKGINALSLRTKLILIFSIAVIIPTLSDGFLYSRVLNQAVQNQMKETVHEVGEFMNVSIQNRMDFMNQLINQLSVSRQLQGYLTTQQDLDALRQVAFRNIKSTINLSMFPGLNEVNYFVLFDSNGHSFYSSIFSNNPEMFNIEKDDLADTDAPYWISGYTDVFNHTTPAIIKRINYWHKGSITQSYLLLVPRDSFLTEVSPMESTVGIKDSQGKQIYAFQPYSTEQLNSLLWSGRIPDTQWQLSIEYSYEDIVLKNSQYYYRLLLIIVLILILSIIISFIIASFLLKPVEMLKRTMRIVGEGDFSRVMSYSGNNEIGEIIRSHNDMVLRLNGVIHENMKMMEENANNKLRENELLSLKTQAELKMLQAQINPHFLYNTLEAINMRSMKNGNSEISLIVSSLAEMFRYSVSNGGGKVPLVMELSHVQNYMSIQQIRFGDQFKYELEVPEHLNHLAVVKFILQPIVENCLKHGLSGIEEGGIIRIKVLEKDELMFIEVSDNGIGMDMDTVIRVNAEIQRSMDNQIDGYENQGGIGLSNVYHRLQLVYKEQVAMKVGSSPMKGTTVTISFPLYQE